MLKGSKYHTIKSHNKHVIGKKEEEMYNLLTFFSSMEDQFFC